MNSAWIQMPPWSPTWTATAMSTLPHRRSSGPVVRIGRGDGTFAAQRNVSNQDRFYIEAGTVADFNRDGWADPRSATPAITWRA
jgi:hypothetical protein